MMERHELLIMKLPKRVGVYLALPTSGGSKVIARFVGGKESVDLFIEWAKAAGATYEEGDQGGT